MEAKVSSSVVGVDVVAGVDAGVVAGVGVSVGGCFGVLSLLL